MRRKDFDEIAKEEFKFLELDYGFKLSQCQKKAGGYELVYFNFTTGVKITYEFREAYISIMLYQLLDGKIVEGFKNINDELVIYGYSFDDIINIRDPSARMKPAYEYGIESEFYEKEKGLMAYISAFAFNLKKYASDILAGDFQIFDKTKKIVEERIRKHQ